MKEPARRYLVLVVAAVIMTWAPLAAISSTDHPLEPPDRSSPQATLAAFHDSIEQAWDLYEAGDPNFEAPFRVARDCLDLSQIPPLVFREVSAETALILKDVLDRIELPDDDEIPDAAAVSELGISRWTIPHTEIALVRTLEGEGAGEWLFSIRTVARAEEYFNKVRYLPYQPGKTGGHVEELRSGTNAFLLMKLVEVMPSWFQTEIGGMLMWQWFGLALLVALMALAFLAAAWLSRRWRGSRLPGHFWASVLVPMTMIAIPFAGRFLIRRIFQLPGAPALTVRLVFSIVGYIGLAWLVAVVLTRIGEMTVNIGFRNARPLKKQLVRVVFRIVTIAVVTGLTLKAMQLLGVPVAGLIAGLGVGGLAIALAAQGTLENFIGGIILYADQPVKVGDICKFGSRRGTVEDVGLRSVKIRTLDRTVVTVPNADFAKLQLENLSERDLVLLRERLCLRYETTREQLKEILAGLEAMLEKHPRIAEERLRVRLTGFGDYSLEVELFAYALTSAYPEFLEIREEVLLEAMAIVESAGTRLALPTEIHYEGGQAASVGRPETGRQAT